MSKVVVLSFKKKKLMILLLIFRRQKKLVSFRNKEFSKNKSEFCFCFRCRFGLKMDEIFLACLLIIITTVLYVSEDASYCSFYRYELTSSFSTFFFSDDDSK